MKFKKIVALLISLAIILSGFGVFCDEQLAAEADGEVLAERVRLIEALISNTNVYKEVGDKELYSAAISEVLKQHPELYDDIMKAMLFAVDENSSYQTPKEAVELEQRLSGEVCGIGVNVFSEYGIGLIAGNVLKNSPAERAGIITGDIIVSSDGVDIREMDTDTAIGYVRGVEGSEALIEIKRAGMTETMIFRIVREKIEENPVSYEIYEDKGVAYIKLSAFNANTNKYLNDVLYEVDQKGITKIILDLRNNVGGYLEMALAVANKFVHNNELIVTEKFREGTGENKYFSFIKDKMYDSVILVNGYSASASEIVTGAVRDNEMGTVVGTTTYGKGTVQTLRGLPWGGSIKYTVATYLTPSGEWIHKKGISPDIYVENTYESVDLDEIGGFKYEKTYDLGDSGAEVKSAKQMLSLLGYYIHDKESDVYDETTQNAVAAFQGGAGLFSYGVLDVTTQVNLYIRMQNMRIEVDKQLEKAFEVFGGEG